MSNSVIDKLYVVWLTTSKLKEHFIVLQHIPIKTSKRSELGRFFFHSLLPIDFLMPLNIDTYLSIALKRQVSFSFL